MGEAADDYFDACERMEQYTSEFEPCRCCGAYYHPEDGWCPNCEAPYND